MPTPNFFIVGAPKAGTDELYYDLDQHPEIYMSPLKEPCYFSAEIRPENFHPSVRAQMQLASEDTRRYLEEGVTCKRFGGIVSSSSDYLKLFSRATYQKSIGEGSVCYLWSKTAPYSIAADIPHARIIIILMDPAERAFHQYLKSVSDGAVGHSFRKHLELAMHPPGPGLNVYNPFLVFGNYTEQLRRYMKCFPRHQLSISLYEDIYADHSAWFSGVLSFLGVDSGFIPREVEVPSKPYVPKFIRVRHALHLGKLKSIAGSVMPTPMKTFARQLVHTRVDRLPTLRSEDRATLVNYYRNDILQLQDLIGRDLSTWLR
jgi:Sulfotransferase family